MWAVISESPWIESGQRTAKEQLELREECELIDFEQPTMYLVGHAEQRFRRPPKNQIRKTEDQAPRRNECGSQAGQVTSLRAVHAASFVGFEVSHPLCSSAELALWPCISGLTISDTALPCIGATSARCPPSRFRTFDQLERRARQPPLSSPQ